jgi:hypothetical protein
MLAAGGPLRFLCADDADAAAVVAAVPAVLALFGAAVSLAVAPPPPAALAGPEPSSAGGSVVRRGGGEWGATAEVLPTEPPQLFQLPEEIMQKILPLLDLPAAGRFCCTCRLASGMVHNSAALWKQMLADLVKVERVREPEAERQSAARRQNREADPEAGALRGQRSARAQRPAVAAVRKGGRRGPGWCCGSTGRYM